MHHLGKEEPFLSIPYLRTEFFLITSCPCCRTAEAISVCDNALIQEKLDYLRMYSELQASLINADEESSAARDAASSASALLGANGGLPEAHWGTKSAFKVLQILLALYSILSVCRFRLGSQES